MKLVREGQLSIGSGNGLAQIRCQAIIWTIDDSDRWYIYITSAWYVGENSCSMGFHLNGFNAPPPKKKKKNVYTHFQLAIGTRESFHT